jgi:hypothetical protein
VGAWRYADGGDWRGFRGVERVASSCGGPVPINVSGDEYRDGRVDRYIVVGDICLDLSDVRPFIETVTAAADEMESATENKRFAVLRSLSTLRLRQA